MNEKQGSDQVHPMTPVLVGIGQAVDRNRDGSGLSPVALIAQSARQALEDAGATEAIEPDAVVMVRLAFDTPVITTRPQGETGQLTQYANPPAALARALNLKPSRCLYNEGGGASPQTSINLMAEMIATGEIRSALIAGGEALATQEARRRQGLRSWEDNQDDSEPEYCGDFKPMNSAAEFTQGLAMPINVYPLFANALRRKYGQSVDEHLQACARLFSPLSQVAAANPLSWFPQAHSAQRLAHVDEENRWVGLPYPKYLNAVMRVNMSAAVLMCSWQEADRLGIDRSQRVFLHGCSQAHDGAEVMARADFAASPAIAHNARQAFEMAGIELKDLSFIDIYSCFPSAVQVSCDAIGLDQNDSRGLTLTGGLPYFGGPGNNYVLHPVAEAVKRLRKQPDAWALVTANGGFLTKHATGVYSSRPLPGRWQAPDYSRVQKQVDAVPRPRPDETYCGEVRVETYTVACGREGPQMAIVVGLSPDGRRTFALVSGENRPLLQSMMREEWLDRSGHIERKGEQNLFTAQA